MRKIYIIPETEQLHVIKEVPLCAGTTEVTGTNENEESGTTGPEMGGSGTGGDFARKQFNLWDEWDE